MSVKCIERLSTLLFLEADSKVDSLSMHLTLIYRKRELTLAMQRVETIKKCDLREIVTLFRHVVNLQVSLCKYIWLLCYVFNMLSLFPVNFRGGQWGVSRGSVDRGSVFCRSPFLTAESLYLRISLIKFIYASPKRTHREGLGESRTGTRQQNLHSLMTASG